MPYFAVEAVPMVFPVDLHMHTLYSDGLLTPEDLLALCHKQGLQCVAVTDHDSTAGLDRAYTVSQALHMAFVPGVELTARYSGEMHILGLGISWHNAALEDFLAHQRSRRTARNIVMVDKLRALGLNITHEGMQKEYQLEDYGRTHFARALVKQGMCSTLAEAFQKYLRSGCPAYIPTERPSSQECIDVIRQAGGEAVLAHPGLMGLPDYHLDPIIGQLQGEGLSGIEAIYPQHTPQQIAVLQRIAVQRGLLVTYGSDYHGKDRAGDEILLGWKEHALPEATWQAAHTWAWSTKEDRV